MFGKKKKREALLKNLDQEFLKIQQRHHLPAGDFPNPEKFRQNLSLYDIDKFKSLKEDLLEKVDEVRLDLSRELMIIFLLKRTIVSRRLLSIYQNSCLGSQWATQNSPRTSATRSTISCNLKETQTVDCQPTFGHSLLSTRQATLPCSIHSTLAMDLCLAPILSLC